MQRALLTVCLVGMFSTLAFAAPPEGRERERREGRLDRPPAESKPQRRASVLTNVDINVSTWLNIGAHFARPQPTQSQSDSSNDDLQKLLDSAQVNAPVQVLTNINVNVSTSVNVAPPSERPNMDELRDRLRDMRPGRPQRGGEQTSIDQEAPQSFEFALSQLSFNDGLQVAVAGQLDSANRAQDLADQINRRRLQTLAGMALLPQLLKADPDAVVKLQEAVNNVKAEPQGEQLVISAQVTCDTLCALKDVICSTISRKRD